MKCSYISGMFVHSPIAACSLPQLALDDWDLALCLGESRPGSLIPSHTLERPMPSYARTGIRYSLTEAPITAPNEPSATSPNRPPVHVAMALRASRAGLKASTLLGKCTSRALTTRPRKLRCCGTAGSSPVVVVIVVLLLVVVV
jgi:hypothetical protein